MTAPTVAELEARVRVTPARVTTGYRVLPDGRIRVTVIAWGAWEVMGRESATFTDLDTAWRVLCRSGVIRAHEDDQGARNAWELMARTRDNGNATRVPRMRTAG